MSPARPALPAPPPRPPDVEDDFTGPDLRTDLWVDHYLPHWTTPERSRARYDLDADGLRLRIDADQPDWRPEDAPLRVSNLQTGLGSGPLGSARGTHRHRPDGLVVRTPARTRLLWAPCAGRVDVTVTAGAGQDTMLALWLAGTEHRSPEESGEVCLMEVDAISVGAAAPVARCGVKAHHDPRLSTDMAEVVMPLDPGRPHTWTALWGARRGLPEDGAGAPSARLVGARDLSRPAGVGGLRAGRGGSGTAADVRGRAPGRTRCAAGAPR